MRLFILGAVASLFLAVGHPASAAVISFSNPDLALADCFGLTGIWSRPLSVYEEAGVRLETHLFQNINYLVDCNQPGGGFGAITDPIVVPISMFADSGDRITVTSLTGDAIRRINLTVTDRFGPPGTCDPLVFTLGFSICDFSGDLNFADYGFPNGVTSFTMRFRTDNFDGVASLYQIEVPEPISGTLLGFGLAAVVYRRYRRPRNT